MGGGVKAAGEMSKSIRVSQRQLHRTASRPYAARCAGAGDDALGHLPLKHQRHAVEPWRPGLALDPAGEQSGGDVIGQVGANPRRTLVADEGAKIDVERIAGDDLEAAGIARGDLCKRREATLIALDGDDLSRAFRQ